jgi:hypothetical protein
MSLEPVCSDKNAGLLNGEFAWINSLFATCSCDIPVKEQKEWKNG